MNISGVTLSNFFSNSLRSTAPSAVALVSSFGITVLFHAKILKKQTDIIANIVIGFSSGMVIAHLTQKRYMQEFGKIANGLSRISCVAFAVLGVIFGVGVSATRFIVSSAPDISRTGPHGIQPVD